MVRADPNEIFDNLNSNKQNYYNSVTLLWVCGKVGVNTTFEFMPDFFGFFDFFDPTPEQQNVVLIDASILQEAERLIESCDCCNQDSFELFRMWKTVLEALS